MAYISPSQSASEKRWLIVSDAGEKVFALTTCERHKDELTCKRMKKGPILKIN